MLTDLPVELITMGASAIGGFLMKQQGEGRKERHAEHMRAIEGFRFLEESRSRAANVPGKWIRRFLVASIVFAVILAPFLLVAFSDATTIVQFTETRGGWLWGLFGPAREKIQFQSLDGYLISPETRQALLAIIAFYFGQAAAK
jgi:hypothetical protein